MKPTIEVVVSPIGEVSIEAIGFKGADCEQATAYLEEALGAISSRQKKPEYYQRRNQQHQQRLGQ